MRPMGGDASRPAVDAAKEALENHFKEVQRYLSLASRSTEPDPDHVHQVRVAARRAQAALRLFGDFIARGKQRRLKRWLRAIRRAAGEARDLDVLLARKSTAGADEAVLLQLESAREDAQRAIEDVHETTDAALALQVKTILASLAAGSRKKGRDEASFGEFARARLTSSVVAYFDEWPLAYDDVDELHALRIRTKSLRYSIELLAGAFSPDLFAPVLQELRDLQAQLGAINDHLTALFRLSEGRDGERDERLKEHLDDEIERERRQLEDEVARFREGWPDRRRGKFEAGLKDALAHGLPDGLSRADADLEVERRYRLSVRPPSSVLKRGVPVAQALVFASDGEVWVRRDPRACVLTARDGGEIFPREWRVKRVPLWVFELMERRAPGRIEKTRYMVEHQGRRWMVDRFHGDLEGLWLLIVKLAADEGGLRLRLPEWAEGAIDVTRDPRYRSRALALEGAPT